MRLIDVDKLKPDVKTFTSAYSEELTEFYSQEAIDNAPTVDAEPERHGEWDNPNDSCRICNQCGLSIVLCDTCKDWMPLSYCPNCGAKMDGGDEDENHR